MKSSSNINRIILLQVFVLSMIAFQCTKPTEYPNVPAIRYIGMSKDSIAQASIASQDSLRITFGFTDGDGDLGDNDSLNVFLTDSRNGQIGQQFKIPFIEQHVGAKGITGEISLTIRQTCCLYDNGQAPCTPGITQSTDTMDYAIQIVDRAGNKSNIIHTEPIYILCK